MFSKKGVVEVQFNWMFVLIAGAIILMFFVNFAMNYREAGEREIAVNVLQELGSLASSSLQASGTAQDVEFVGLSLEVYCNPDSCNIYGCDQRFDFGGRRIAAPEWMDIEPIFSSRNIDSDHLLLWTLPWQAPFHVTNFLYLTDPEHRFIFDCNDEITGSCGLAGNVYSRFSENVYANHKYITLNDIGTVSYEGERQNNFIMFIEPDENFAGFEGISDDTVRNRINVLFVDPDESSVDYGDVHFGSVDDDGSISGDFESSSYIGKPMLIGAIFSDEKSDYKCNVRKAILKFLNVNDIYKTKAEELDSGCFGPDCDDCVDYYGDDEDQTGHFMNEMGDQIDENYDIQEVGEFYGYVDGLDRKNRDILRRGCPRLY